MQAGSGSSKDVLGVLLSSFNHTLAVTYKPGNGWGFMDINQYPPKVYKVEETGLLAKMIIKGLNSVPPSSYLALDASIYTTTRNPQVYSLTTQLGQFKSSHVMTQEIASREQNGMGLAWIAARIGDVALISELAKHQVDFNKADKDGFTPAHIAALTGQSMVLDELIKSSADLSPSLISLTDWKGKAYLKKVAVARMNSFLNYHKDKQAVLLSPRDLAVIMGDENEIQHFLDNVVEPHLRYAGRADLAEKDKDNEPLPKDVIACLNQLISLKRQNEILESYLAETETLLDAIKENEQRVIDRKYYIDFIDEHKESYTNVMWHISSPEKEELFQNETQLRHSGLSSTVLYGMSWATSLFSTCYRFLTPKLQQKYLDSLMPQTLDSQSKALFKRLLQGHKDNLKKEKVMLEQSIANTNKKLFPQSEEIFPLFNTLSSKNLQLLPIYEFRIVNSVRADDRPTPKEHSDTQNFMHQKSTMSILKIPATEREENIYAVFQMLECPLMCNEDGSIPRILKEIKAIISRRRSIN